MKSLCNSNEMRVLTHLRLLVPTLVIALASGSGCSEGGSGGGSGSSGGFQAIESSGRAEFIVEDLADGVITRNVLPSIQKNVDMDNFVINGNTGTATVTGNYDYDSNVYCGSSCVRSQTDADLLIFFDRYTVMSADNTEAVVSGYVFYENNRYSQQSGSGYTSGGGVTVTSAVDYSITYQVSDIDTGTFAYRDTILEFVGVGRFAGNLNGYVIDADGTRYDF